ncbi:hypothetical protein [Halorubrum sp. SY-15]|uniref:hypothetical protein n=1 Tax=Halorubrum sp. SY-15 TaxID=3402277 RepID=UPI003EB7DA14
MSVFTRLLVAYGVLLAVGVAIYREIDALDVDEPTELRLVVAAALGGVVVSLYVGSRLLE